LDDTTPFKLFGKTISTQYKKQQEKNIWIDCDFELVDLLKNDHSGKVGENFLHYLCDCNNIDNQYVEDINSKDGVYDIKILNKKIEIKTARLSQCGSFQHENLRNEGCDYYVFLDITPRCIYITILPSFNLSEKCKVMNRTPHLRKGSSNIYKFDFDEKKILNAIELGYSIKITENTTMDEIGNFIRNKIVV
jgi:hypothetical protein